MNVNVRFSEDFFIEDNSLKFSGLRHENGNYVFTTQKDEDSLIRNIVIQSQIFEKVSFSLLDLKDYGFERIIKIAKHFKSIVTAINNYNGDLEKTRQSKLVRMLMRIPLINRVVTWWLKDLFVPNELTKQVLNRAISIECPHPEQLKKEKSDLLAQKILVLSIDEIEQEVKNLQAVNKIRSVLDLENSLVEQELKETSVAVIWENKQKLIDLVEEFCKYYQFFGNIEANEAADKAKKFIQEKFEARLLDLIPALKVVCSILENQAKSQESSEPTYTAILGIDANATPEVAKTTCNEALRSITIAEADEPYLFTNLRDKRDKAGVAIKIAYGEWYSERLEGAKKIEDLFGTDASSEIERKYKSLIKIFQLDKRFNKDIVKVEKLYESYLSLSCSRFAHACYIFNLFKPSPKASESLLLEGPEGWKPGFDRAWYQSQLEILQSGNEDDLKNPIVKQKIEMVRNLLQTQLNTLYTEQVKKAGEDLSKKPSSPGVLDKFRVFFGRAPSTDAIFVGYKEKILQLLKIKDEKAIPEKYKEIYSSLASSSDEEALAHAKTLKEAFDGYQRSKLLEPLVAIVRTGKTLSLAEVFPSLTERTHLNELERSKDDLLHALNIEKEKHSTDENVQNAIREVLENTRVSIEAVWEEHVSVKFSWYKGMRRILKAFDQQNPPESLFKTLFKLKGEKPVDCRETYKKQIEKFSVPTEDLPKGIQKELLEVQRWITIAYKEWESERIIAIEEKPTKEMPKSVLKIAVNNLLGLPNNSSIQQQKDLYRELQLLLHTDRNRETPEPYLSKILEAGKLLPLCQESFMDEVCQRLSS